MKKIVIILFILPLFISCTGRAIEPISNHPIPKRKAPLNVWSVIPYWSRYTPGLKVNIHGVGFEPGAVAFIGGKECIETRFRSDTVLRCKVADPEGHGDKEVTVINPDGSRAPIKVEVDPNEPDTYDRFGDKEEKGGDGMVYFFFPKPHGWIDQATDGYGE